MKEINETLYEELCNLLEVESKLVSSFQKHIRMILLGKGEDSIYSLYERIEKENDRIALSSYKNFELSFFHDSLRDLDFTEIYFLEDPYPCDVRLFYHVQNERMKRMREKSFKRNFLEMEKKEYYMHFYHLRIVESFMKCASAFLGDSVSQDFLEVFYRIWYCTPGIEVPTDVRVSLPCWMVGKGVSLLEYQQFECHLLKEFWNYFLVEFHKHPLEQLSLDVFRFFFLTFCNLSLEYFSVFDFKVFLQQFDLPSKHLEYLFELLQKFGKKKDHLKLVPKLN